MITTKCRQLCPPIQSLPFIYQTAHLLQRKKRFLSTIPPPDESNKSANNNNKRLLGTGSDNSKRKGTRRLDSSPSSSPNAHRHNHYYHHNHDPSLPIRDESFSELPNILNHAFGLNFVPFEGNEAHSNDKFSKNYGIDMTMMDECLAIAQSTLLYSRNNKKRASTRLINPALLLAYTGSNGEMMMKKLAMTLAKQLEADFLELSITDLIKSTVYLKEQVVLTRQRKYLDMQEATIDFDNGNGSTVFTNLFDNTTEPNSSSSSLLNTSWTSRTKAVQYNDKVVLSDFLRKKIEQNGNSSATTTSRTTKSSSNGINNINHSTLEYLEFCMKSIKESTGKNRVIYLHAGAESFLDSSFTSEFYKFISTTVTSRTSSGTSRTLFVVSEGDNFDCEEEGNNYPDPKLSSTSINNGSITINSSGNLLLPSTMDSLASTSILCSNSGGLFDFLIDNGLQIPRIVIASPRDPTLASIHRAAINADAKLSCFIHNYNGILERLGPLSNNSLTEGLSIVDNNNCLKESSLAASLAMLMQKLSPLQKRKLSGNELLALCLSVPSFNNHDKVNAAGSLPVDPLTILTETVETFFANRAIQTASFLSKLKSSDKFDIVGSETSLNKHERRLLPCIVTPAMVNTRFEDIGALDQVKNTLYELISFRLERPELFTKGILKDSVSGILLFGPPGTGKTMLAKAVAARSGANFLSVNSSSIFDMYVGEGEKNVKALFTLARKMSPCVIFIDEVDALLDSRSNSIGRASRVEIINEFMSEWDGLLSQNHGITIMAATNRPFSLDDAVLRRLPRRILIDLPATAAREQILKLLLKDDSLAKDVNLTDLANQCDFYSGSDLKNVAMAAAIRALRRQDHSVDGFEIKMSDFLNAIGDCPASVSEQMPLLQELERWNKQFGEGNKTNKSRNSALGFKL